VLCRGKAHSGTCAIAIASLVCGLHAASPSLVAQPLGLLADQPATDESPASFEERFSSGFRTQPVFTHPDIQNLLASMPSSIRPEEVFIAGAGIEPAASLPEVRNGMPAEPQSVENTASVTAQEPGLQATMPVPEGSSREAVRPSSMAPTPNQEAQLPEFPPPPPPAEIVLPSVEELAAESPSEAAPQLPANTSSVSRSEPDRQAEASKPPISQTQRSLNLKKHAVQRAARAKKQTTALDPPTVTGAISHCRTGSACVSQQQTFAIFLGFLMGGLLGGPGGAMVGGAAGALLTAPDPSTGKPAHQTQQR
jgi:hypothetical protein